MTPSKADKIVRIYGRYLEYCSKMTVVFDDCIPESFLPFPKSIPLEALNIVAENHHKRGNQHGVELMREVASELIAYGDDEEALSGAAKNFNNPKWREVFIPMLKNLQKEWIKSQRDF